MTTLLLLVAIVVIMVAMDKWYDQGMFAGRMTHRRRPRADESDATRDVSRVASFVGRRFLRHHRVRFRG